MTHAAILEIEKKYKSKNGKTLKLTSEEIDEVIK